MVSDVREERVDCARDSRSSDCTCEDPERGE